MLDGRCTATRWSGSITTPAGANDVINDRTRREYRRLLIKYALPYFATDTLLRDIDEHGACGFVEWLCRRSDEAGHRLCDRSIRNAVLPLQSCLRHAARCGLLGEQAEPMLLLHSAAFTLDNYGHLIDDGLGPSLDLSDRLAGLAPVALQPVV